MLTHRHVTDTLSTITHKNTSLQHCLMFHVPYTEKLLAKLGIYVYTSVHTHICVLWSQRCYWCLYALSSSAINFLKRVQGRLLCLYCLGTVWSHLALFLLYWKRHLSLEHFNHSFNSFCIMAT